MKKIFAFTFLVFFLISGNLYAEDLGKETTSKTKKTFSASSLWEVRRGPNAPKPSPSPSLTAEDEKKKLKTAAMAASEALAKQAYLNSLQGNSSHTTTVSSSGAKECAKKN